MVKRIVPDPPPRAGDASRDVWGFRDSGFVVDDAGHVIFRGARSAISGKRIPRLLPWVEGILGLRVDPFDKHVSAYPTAIPDASRIRRSSACSSKSSRPAASRPIRPCACVTGTATRRRTCGNLASEKNK